MADGGIVVRMLRGMTERRARILKIVVAVSAPASALYVLTRVWAGIAAT